MPTANHLYDPEWESIHDHHAEKRSALQKKISVGHQDGSSADYIEQCQKEFSEHHQACLNSFRMRFETVQGYAEWLFENF